MLKAAIEFVGGKHCKYVPKKYRPKSEMIEQLEAYCMKWFGMTMDELRKEDARLKDIDEHYSDGLWENHTTCSFLDEPKQRQLHGACAKGFGITGGDRYVVLKRSPGSVDFADRNNVAWAKSSRPALNGALMFRIGADRIVPGKTSIIKAVLNLGIHIHKGCFDLHDGNYGLGFYQDVGAPVSKGPRKGLVVIETAIGQNELESHFRSMNHATATTLTLTDPELEARLCFGYLNQNYNVDVKNGRSVPPNPVYWRFNRANSITQTVFGFRLWNYRNPMTVELEDEPLLGYGSYRYETAGSDLTPEARLQYALKGFKGSKSQNRWTYNMSVNLSSAEVKTNRHSPTIQPSPNTSPFAAETVNPRSKPREKSGAPKAVALPLALSAATGSSKRKAVCSSEKVQSLKRRRVAVPCARSSKTIQTGSKRGLIKTYFTPQAPSKRDESEIRGRIAATIASSPKSVSAEKVCVKVARAFNESRLSSAATVTGRLISSESVAKVMHNCAKGAAASKTLHSVAPRPKRNAYKNKPLETLYPLSLEELLRSEGVKTNRAVRILRHMKSWSRDNCSNSRGIIGKTPIGVSNGSKALANYGLRVMFQRMQLRQLGFKNDKFFPVYASRKFWFGELANGEVRHHRRESRLDALELCQEPLT